VIENFPGQRVRLRGDPMRVGVCMGNERHRSNQRLLQVVFTDSTSWVPEDQLEFLSSWRDSPRDLLDSDRPLSGVRDLRRTLTHVRLTGRLADVIYSMETTNTDFYAYQFKPVLKLLNSPSNSLLIADEVGLGKTIEAGLIWTELRSRYDMRRLLVLCPAVLREKWRDELYYKMGIEADIVGVQELLRVLRDSDRALRGFALISSIQGFRPGQDWEEANNKTPSAQLARYLQERENEERLVDLLVIDEAHYLRNPETQANQVGHLVRNVSEYHVFLTATPLHTQNQNLFSLLNLLDPDTFVRMEDFADILGANRPLLKARDYVLSSSPSLEFLRDLLQEAGRHTLLRENRQLAGLTSEVERIPDLSDPATRTHLGYRLDSINLLSNTVNRTRKRDITERRVVREPRSESVELTPAERRFYDLVTEIVVGYAMERDINQRFLLATPQRLVSSSMVAAFRNWQKRGLDWGDGEGGEDDEEGEALRHRLGPLTQRIVDRVIPEFRLEDLERYDSKYQRLKEILKNFFSTHPNAKVVLFSTFHSTLDYLEECLGKDQIPTMVLKGGQRESKYNTIQRFREISGSCVLLSSEVGGEGMDMQFSWVVINYDLPWNPMRLEQRIGRVDRLGQTAEKVIIWNLFYGDTIDSRIYQRLYERLDLCRQALGDFEPILGREFQRLEADLLAGHLTPEQQEARIDQTALALANLKAEEERLEENAAHLIAHGDYILKQIHEAHNLNRWITERDLQAYVLDFFHLHYQGSTFLQVDPLKRLFDINLSIEGQHALERFVRANNLSMSTRLTQSMAGPVRCRFQNRVSASIYENGIEIITQFHPIVRFVSHEISRLEEQLTPAVAFRLRQCFLTPKVPVGIYILVSALWSIKGVHTIERLTYAGCSLASPEELLPETTAEQMIMTGLLEGKDWLEAGGSIDRQEMGRIADERLFEFLADSSKKFYDEVIAENLDRADLQERNLARHLENQTAQLERVRDGHLEHRRMALVRATEGRLTALKNRIERERLRIAERRNIKYSPQKDTCVVLVKITDD